jgi:hypothetical protein
VLFYILPQYAKSRSDAAWHYYESVTGNIAAVNPHKLEQFPWYYTLDPLRRNVITEIGIDRLNRPMRLAMEYANWVGAAFELCNSLILRRDLGEAHCKDLAYALEYGHPKLT